MRRAALLAALLLALAGCHDDGRQQGSQGGGGSAAGAAEAPADGDGTERQDGEKPQDGGKGEKAGKETADDPTQVGAEQAVRTVIDGVLTSGEPLIACDLYVTPRYLRTSYGGRDGCNRAQGEKATADSVAIKKVSVKGAKAAAVAVPSGGASDGERLEIALVHQGGAWRIDRIRSDVPVGP